MAGAAILCAGLYFMGNTDRNSEIEEMNIESETELEDNSLEVYKESLPREISSEMSLESIVDVLKKCVRLRQRDNI